MDPQETWLAMIQALIDDEPKVAAVYAADLYDWLQRGGFPPRVLPDLGQTNDPQSIAYRIDRMIVFYVCARAREET